MHNYTLSYHPGKALGYANALRHLPLSDPVINLSPVHSILLLEEFPQLRLHTSDMSTHTAKDHTLSQVLNWGWRWWPAGQLDVEFWPFSSLQHELSVHKGCLLWGN